METREVGCGRFGEIMLLCKAGCPNLLLTYIVVMVGKMTRSAGSRGKIHLVEVLTQRGITDALLSHLLQSGHPVRF